MSWHATAAGLALPRLQALAFNGLACQHKLPLHLIALLLVAGLSAHIHPTDAAGQPARALHQAAGLGQVPACNNKPPRGYAYVPYRQPWGYDIGMVPMYGTGQYAWRLLAEACNKEPKCQCIATGPWAKYGYPPLWAWNPRNADMPCAGTLVKLGQNCSQYSVCQQGCVADNKWAPWQYNCTCSEGYQLSPDRLNCYSPPFGNIVDFTDVPDFSSRYLFTDPKYRDPHVWLFKGSRLALAVMVDSMQPALAEFTNVTLNDTLAAYTDIVRTVQGVLTAADALLRPRPLPFAVREHKAWVNDTLIDNRVLWEASYATDNLYFYYNAQAGSMGFTTHALPLVGMLRRALAGQPAIDHDLLLLLAKNYMSDDLVWALDWRSQKQVDGSSLTTHSWLYASLCIMMNTQLPQVQPILSNLGSFGNVSQLLDYYEGFILRYMNDTKYTWENTWYQGEFPGEGDTMLALHAGLFVHLYRRFGGSDYGFVQRFAQSVSQLSNRLPFFLADHQRARDNYFIAASVAASDKDLRSFFTQSLRWKISPGTAKYLQMRYKVPR